MKYRYIAFTDLTKWFMASENTHLYLVYRTKSLQQLAFCLI